MELAGAPSIRGVDYVTGGRTKTANIPGKVFASALLELATIKAAGGNVQTKLAALAANYAGSPLGDYMKTLADHAGNDIDSVINAISDWFDQQMSRVTQTYRKNIKYVLAVLGLIIVGLCNVDTIHVAQGLARDADLRQVITATAGEITKNDVTANCTVKQDDPTRKTLECGLQKLTSFSGTGVVIPFSPGWSENWTKTWSKDTAATHVIGLAITTGAVALGGPMWFDFLILLTGRKRTS